MLYTTFSPFADFKKVFKILASDEERGARNRNITYELMNPLKSQTLIFHSEICFHLIHKKHGSLNITLLCVYAPARVLHP